MNDLEQSLVKLKEKLDKTEADNTEMATMLGVTTFEKNKISKIIDSMSFGVIITDIQDNINYINAYMLSLLNKEWKDVVDRPLGEIINQDEIISFISQQESLKATSNPGQLETTFPDIAPGELFGVSSSYLHDSEGAVIGKISSVKNISAEKSMETASQDFIANVAHEFLTPLTTINSYNEILMDEEIEDKEMAKEFHNTISEEAARLTRLVQNLLSISKIEMGAMTLSTGLVKTESLVEDSFQTIETPAREKQITINTNLPDNFPSLIGDKELFKTAIINLLGNAVKYSPEKSSITFSLTENDDKVIFEISDTGYGISEEDLPHIFEKFYRSTDSQITEQKGSGLGLAMTSEIIRLHGGEIEVESELGKGTHFIISIPKEEYYLAKH
jgi:two-component system phosphate regulon sensor histidine kinase PhoR